MATLGEILEHRHGVAMAAASMRYYNGTIESLSKTASEKEAGLPAELAGKALAGIKKFNPFKLSPAHQVAKDLEATQMAIGKSLMSHFHSKFPVPHAGASAAERADFAKNIADYVAKPSFKHTEETVYKVVKDPLTGADTKQIHEVRHREIPVQGTGIGAFKAMGDLQKALEPKKMTVNSVLGVVSGLGLGIGGVSKLMDARAHSKNLDDILADPQIPKTHHARAKDVFGVLARYAPSIAKDPTIAKDFTKNLIRHETVDHHTVKTLVDAEKVYNETQGRKAEFWSSIGQKMVGGGGRL